MFKRKRYLVEARWWSQWCDYTNFDSAQLSHLEQELFDSHRRSESSGLCYQKPGRICNEGLLEAGGALRANLVEHFDFEAVPPQLWLYLYSWYSSDC